jgi:hypothetical protein
MSFSQGSIIGLSIALGFFFIILPISLYLINTFSSQKNTGDYDYSPESSIWSSPTRNSFSGQYADDAALSGIGGRKRNSKYKKLKGKKHYKNKK